MSSGFRRNVTLLAIGAGVVASPAFASDDAQLWTTLNVNVKLSDRWRAQNELVFRFSDTRDGLYEIENNTLIGYAVDKDKKIAVWAGYTHDPQYAAGRFTIMEHRGREQVTFDNIAKLGPVNLSLRMRVEQRWREGIDGTAWRLRPFVRASMPIAGKTTFNLSHESFIDLNTTNFQRVEGEERMRNAAFIVTPLMKKVNLEAGYLWQHGFVAGGEDTNDHAGTVTLALSF